MSKKRSVRLSRTYAYFRLAAKADRARQGQQAQHYRGIAYRLVDEDRREREWMASRRAK